MRHVAILVFPGVNLLDVAGPAQAFTSAAELYAETAARTDRAYRVSVVSLGGGLVETTSGIQIQSCALLELSVHHVDTLLIAGGHGSEAAGNDKELVTWLHDIRGRLRRLGSICTGAFVLAGSGLAAGRRLATHWAYCDRLQAQHPEISVERNAIFIQDGGLWSSAGITSGLDLALAMIEEDFGRDLALMVARRLVVFLKRPGGQSQFSVPLQSQTAEGPLAQLVSWVSSHPAADHRVDALAARINVSPRTLHRLFRQAFAQSPAQWVLRMRIESARRLLEQTSDSLGRIATKTGLGSPDTMRRVFLREFGVAPLDYRERFQREPAPPSQAIQHAFYAPSVDA